MKPCPKRNLTTPSGLPLAIVELGTILFFDGDIQRYYEVESFDDRARPFNGSIDLFQLSIDSKITPIVFVKEIQK